MTHLTLKHFSMYFLRTRIFSYITIITIRKLTLIQYHLIFNPYLHLVNSPPNVLHSKNFPEPGSNSGLHIAFSCHVSLVTFNLKQFLCLLFFKTLTFLNSTGQLFCRIFFNLEFPVVSSWLDQTSLHSQNNGNNITCNKFNCLMTGKMVK